MKINTEHLKRYKEILQLVWKYGRSDLVQQMAIDQDLGNGERVQAGSGQVHTAALRDGFEVVVKVQRPGVEKQLIEDFEVLGQITALLDKHTEIGRRHRFCEMLEELRVSIMNELNYEREAQSLISMGDNLKEYDLIVIPQPIVDFTTKRVLTMERIDGGQ